MLGSVVLCLSTLHIYRVMAQGECTDVRGRSIAHGLHYVPYPDTCTLCICDNGQPKVCKAVLCSPPQDCRSFRVGNTCCEYICLDDVVKPAEGTEANMRVAAGGAATVVLLTLALIVYRVRKQKRRRPPHTDDQRSLTSIGYISGSMAYVGTTCETGLSAWKPPTNYMPHGEAPPPYDEAVAQSRAEAMRYWNQPMLNETTFHRTYPATVESLSRPDELQCTGHNFVNLSRPITQVANNQGTCFNAPLLQPMHTIEPREPPHSMVHHPLAANVTVGFPSAIRLTGSLGTITNRGLLSLLQRSPPAPDHDRPHNVPGFYSNGGALAMHSSLHRTIPRISTAADASALDAAISSFQRGDRSLHGEVRRSFHRPGEGARRAGDGMEVGCGATVAGAGGGGGRSMPRNLGLASARAHSEGKLPPPPAPLPDPAPPLVQPLPPQPLPPPSAILPLTVDKPSCVCSYEGSSAPGAEETDDYRSECENCKSASSSRWVLEEGWSESGEEGTQTLQRRAPPAPAPPIATATLPQPVTKPRTSMGPPSNWENWFNTIPDSDSESEEE